ncbi:MAG: hypothetical protein EZS28_000210 [Streblomastix strix]|uniref:Uncharacterized protein n=1 Tax=Streblomastix strix TaxID=222440 RepID=A0A5J4XBF2_9EUKA|nr:MAG: hypothetical protein EZS28_000210 [Streblomastix strix]
MTTLQTNQIRVHKSKHASTVKKELSEEDKARLQAIDEAITNGFRKALQIPTLQIQSSIQTPQQSRDRVIDEEYEPQREIQTERPRRHKCVDSRKQGEDFILNSDNYIKLWALITQEEEKDIEVVMEEPLMRYNSCTSKKYKKNEIVRVDDVLTKNVSISNIDNVLCNNIEKLYQVNKDFITLSDKLESDIGPQDF